MREKKSDGEWMLAEKKVKGRIGIECAAHTRHEDWFEHCLRRRFKKAIMTGENFGANRYITLKLGGMC